MGTIIALGGGRYDDGEVMPIFERIVRESGIGAEDGAALIFKDGHFSAMCGNDGGSVFYFDKDNGFEKSDITEDASALDI